MRSEFFQQYLNDEMDFDEYMRRAGLHYCESSTSNIPDRDGMAVEHCAENEEDSYLWASNGEYSTAVNFCCFCGYKAKEMPNDE